MEVRRILLTGFEPFGGLSENISWQIAEFLGGTSSIVELGPRESGSGQALHRSICVEWVAPVSYTHLTLPTICSV